MIGHRKACSIPQSHGCGVALRVVHVSVISSSDVVLAKPGEEHDVVRSVAWLQSSVKLLHLCGISADSRKFVNRSSIVQRGILLSSFVISYTRVVNQVTQVKQNMLSRLRRDV